MYHTHVWPLLRRPDLIGCVCNEWLATQLTPDKKPGRYRMDWSKGGPRYRDLPVKS